MRHRALVLVLSVCSVAIAACSSDAASDPEATTAASTAATGTMTMRYDPVAGVDAADLGDLSTLADRLTETLTAAGYVARVTGGTSLTIEVRQVVEADRDAVLAAIDLDPRRVLLRPVIECAPQDASSASAPPATTSDSSAAANDEVVPLTTGGTCTVGPAAGDGTGFLPDADAQIVADQGWGVVVGLRDGADGLDAFNALAASCYAGDASCPSHQIAIEVDGAIVSAPTVQTPEFIGSVQIVGTFSEAAARGLAGTLLAASVAGRLQLAAETFTTD